MSQEKSKISGVPYLLRQAEEGVYLVKNGEVIARFITEDKDEHNTIVNILNAEDARWRDAK